MPSMPGVETLATAVGLDMTRDVVGDGGGVFLAGVQCAGAGSGDRGGRRRRGRADRRDEEG